VKFLDTNAFLRYMVEPKTENDRLFRTLVAALFERAERGEDQFTTTDAVMAEVAFVLTSPRHYGISRHQALIRVVPLIRLPGCAIAHQEELESAFSRWEENPRISFVDALAIAIAKKHGFDLVTFDTAMAHDAETLRWDLRSSESDV
jgi:predicted nucleic acid-binding protein